MQPAVSANTKTHTLICSFLRCLWSVRIQQLVPPQSFRSSSPCHSSVELLAIVLFLFERITLGSVRPFNVNNDYKDFYSLEL